MVESEFYLGTLQSALSEAHDLRFRGLWKDAIHTLEPLVGTCAAPLTKSYLELGINYRMVLDYTKGESAFKAALQLARNTGDLGLQVEALNGLVDLCRTGGRDPNFGQRLDEAIPYRNEAYHIVMRQMPPGWNLPKVNFFINSALLSWEFDMYNVSLEYIEQAEAGFNELLDKNPSDKDLLNRHARTLTVKGVTLENLERLDEAILCQLGAYTDYVTLDDVRGIGNAAMSVGNIYQKLGNNEAACDWFEKALAASQKDGEILDQTTYDFAKAAIKSTKRSLFRKILHLRPTCKPKDW